MQRIKYEYCFFIILLLLFRNLIAYATSGYLDDRPQTPTLEPLTYEPINQRPPVPYPHTQQVDFSSITIPERLH